MSDSRIWPFISAAIGALAWLPSRVGAPSAALDASWGSVLHEAARQSWQFGTDIVFTYGPLGYLAVPTFAPDIFWWMVAFHVVVGAACGWAVHAIVREAGWPGWAAPVSLLALLPPTMASSDIPMLLPAVLWPFLALRSTRPRAEPALLALSAVVGAVGLVKFTTFMLAVALAVVLGIDEMARRRRFPRAATTFLVAVMALWLAAGQRPGAFPAWVHTSFETASAYSEAMSTPVGPYQRRELLLFAVSAGALLGLAVWHALRDSAHRAAAIALPASLLLVVFVQFKLGFVRHDAHATVAMGLMPPLAALVGAGVLAHADRRRFRLVVTGAVMLLAVTCYAYGLRRYFDRLSPVEHYRASYALQVATALEFARPAQLQARLSRERERALAGLRAELPLPASIGSIDMYGYQQGLLLAHPVTYAPRPIFQSYGAYTEGLAALNRRVLEDPRGPHDVLLDVTTIDHRYPLMDDGASLPAWLARFDVRGLVGGFVHLERRAVPRTVSVAPLGVVSAAPGERLVIGSHAGVIWAEVDVDRSVVGRLLAMLYKLPPIYLEVTTADGIVRPHRIIRPLARGGMLLSPLVRSNDELRRLVAGEPPMPAQQVTAVRLLLDWPTAYASQVRLRLSRISVQPG